MRAMILAAGVGSRLSPITDKLPKPLVPVLGKPVLGRIIELLNSHNIKQIIANTHYLADKVYNQYENLIELVYERELTGVAGGIRACKDFLARSKEPFVIIMGDALTNINLTEMIKAHQKSEAKVTISTKQVQDTSQFGVICFDQDNTVTSFQEKPSSKEALSDWANTGVYIFEPEVLDYIPSKNQAFFYDVANDLFPNLLKLGVKISVYQTDSYWADLGTHQQYREAVFECLKSEKIKIKIPEDSFSWGYLGFNTRLGTGTFVNGRNGKTYLGPNCQIGENVLFEGFNVVEEGTTIENNCILKNSLVLGQSKIKKDSCLVNQNVGFRTVFDNRFESSDLKKSISSHYIYNFRKNSELKQGL